MNSSESVLSAYHVTQEKKRDLSWSIILMSLAVIMLLKMSDFLDCWFGIQSLLRDLGFQTSPTLPHH